LEIGYFGKFGILGSLLYGKLGVFEKLGILEVGYFEIGYFGKLGILKLQPHTHTGGFGNAAVVRRGGGVGLQGDAERLPSGKYCSHLCSCA
jgi:hypothetical protein